MNTGLPQIELQQIDLSQEQELILLKHDYNKVAQRLNTQADKLSDEEKKELHKELLLIKMRIRLYA